MKILKWLEQICLLAGMLHVGFLAFCYFQGYELSYYPYSSYVTFFLLFGYYAISIFRDSKEKNIRKMNKVVLVIGLIALCVGIFGFFPSQSPSPTVTAGDTEIPTVQGGYCWNGDLAVCAGDPLKTPAPTPTVVSPKEEIKIEYPKGLTAERVKAEKMMDENNGKPVNNLETNNGAVVAPEEKGVYVYHVLASWKQEEANFSFRIKVE
ncbi:acyltransferase [Gracilibacillus oryzae]|uniref:Acyltransferase n=1 Tax=Gracilibacillus oryzae TaxID=1672701 RepID=A0A7C8KS12_9BACI|nr:hypothetical protein [Gracilibacillus oryzae]KAB8136240.1 acyltransferase [Gracilibacillus oryzae]